MATLLADARRLAGPLSASPNYLGGMDSGHPVDFRASVVFVNFNTDGARDAGSVGARLVRVNPFLRSKDNENGGMNADDRDRRVRAHFRAPGGGAAHVSHGPSG